MNKIEELKNCIVEKKLYTKIDIAESLKVSIPTVRSWLKSSPDIEALRQENKTDRAEYLREYGQKYERPKRDKEYLKQYREANKEKINERKRIARAKKKDESK